MKFLSLIKNMLQSVPGRALSSVLMLASVFFAIFSAFPVLSSYLAGNRKKGFYVILIAGFFCYILGGWQLASFYILTVGIVSVVLAELTIAGLRFSRVIFISTLITSSFYLLFLLVVSYTNSSGVIDYLSMHVGSAVMFMNTKFPDVIKQALIESGMSESELISHIVLQIPSTTVVILVMFIFLNMLMISGLNRQTQEFLKLQKLQTFRMPDVFVWVAILAGALYIYASSKYNDITLLQAMSGFLFKGMMMFYFLHGMLIAYVFTSLKIPSSFLRILLFSLLIVFAYVFVTAVGFFDTWFDFRKYLKKGEES